MVPVGGATVAVPPVDFLTSRAASGVAAVPTQTEPAPVTVKLGPARKFPVMVHDDRSIPFAIVKAESANIAVPVAARGAIPLTFDKQKPLSHGALDAPTRKAASNCVP